MRSRIIEVKVRFFENGGVRAKGIEATRSAGKKGDAVDHRVYILLKERYSHRRRR